MKVAKALIIGINLSMTGSTGTIMNNVFEWVEKTNPLFHTYTITPEENDKKNHLAYDSKHSLFFKLKYYLKYQVFKKPIIDGDYFTENSKKIVKEIEQLSKQYSNIVIHFHNIHNARIDVAYLYRYLIKKKIPVVYSVHDSWIYTGGCYCYDYIKCEKWKTNCFNCPLSVLNSSHNLYLRTNLLNKLSPYYIAVSEWEKNELLMSKLNIKNIKVINGETNITYSSPNYDIKRKLGLEGFKVLISVSSYWNDWKGIKHIYKLADLLPNDYRLLVVGGEIKEHEKIVHIPTVNDLTELSNLYSIADVYISTTQSEALGLTTCEAQICGIPIVGFGNGGSKETFTKKTGVLIKKNDVKEMLNKIIDICEKRIVFDKKEIINQGMKFSKYSSAKKYFEIYKEVLNINEDK